MCPFILNTAAFTVTAAVIVTGGYFGGAQAQSPAGQTGNEILVQASEVKWQTMPRDWTNGPPPGHGISAPPEVAIIWGDPTKPGVPFMFWLKSSARGATVPIPPHSHPTDERITVLSGVFCLGMGDKYDANACKDMPAGSYMVMPAGMNHFAVGKDSVIEVYGIGPFKINWLRGPS